MRFIISEDQILKQHSYRFVPSIHLIQVWTNFFNLCFDGTYLLTFDGQKIIFLVSLNLFDKFKPFPDIRYLDIHYCNTHYLNILLNIRLLNIRYHSIHHHNIHHLNIHRLNSRLHLAVLKLQNREYYHKTHVLKFL
jgi:hypothetical protein